MLGTWPLVSTVTTITSIFYLYGERGVWNPPVFINVATPLKTGDSGDSIDIIGYFRNRVGLESGDKWWQIAGAVRGLAPGASENTLAAKCRGTATFTRIRLW